MKAGKIIVIAPFLIALFLYTRFYNISNSLEFFGDIGRDHLVLWQWWITGKPPLLGPGVSFFALHLPPLYFYLNFPAFVISKFSVYSTLITLTALYLTSFILGLKYCRTEKFRLAVILIFLLIIFHPQYILQSRLPWNPSFAPPFLLASLLTFLGMLEKYSLKKAVVFALGLMSAVSLSLQTVPVVLSIIFFALILFTRRIEIILSIFLSALLLFFPLIFFEVKHNFFFLRRFSQNPVVQPIQTDMSDKLMKHLNFLLGIRQWDEKTLFIIIALTLIFAVSLFLLTYKRELKEKSKVVVLAALFLVSSLFTYILPFPAREYDIFAVSVLLFALIAFLPFKLSIIYTLLLLLLWIDPAYFQQYFSAGHRTVGQMDKCAQTVCLVEKEPMFISAQAWYIYHSTPEYQFLFSKNGCSVTDITQKKDWTNSMAVIADNATYEHGKTSFNELTLFGPSMEQRVYKCEDNLKVYILKRQVAL